MLVEPENITKLLVVGVPVVVTVPEPEGVAQIYFGGLAWDCRKLPVPQVISGVSAAAVPAKRHRKIRNIKRIASIVSHPM